MHNLTTEICLSNHAQERMRQRGISNADVDLVRAFGTPVDDGYIVTRKDVECLEQEVHVQRLERLVDTAVIEQEGTIVTVYRASKQRRRRLLGHDGRCRRNRRPTSRRRDGAPTQEGLST